MGYSLAGCRSNPENPSSSNKNIRFHINKYEEEEKFIRVGPVGGILGGHIGGGGGTQEYNDYDGDLVDIMTVITIMIWWTWCKLLKIRTLMSMVTVIKSMKIIKYLWISTMTQISIIIIINKQRFHIK